MLRRARLVGPDTRLLQQVGGHVKDHHLRLLRRRLERRVHLGVRVAHGQDAVAQPRLVAQPGALNDLLHKLHVLLAEYLQASQQQLLNTRRLARMPSLSPVASPSPQRSMIFSMNSMFCSLNTCGPLAHPSAMARMPLLRPLIIFTPSPERSIISSINSMSCSLHTCRRPSKIHSHAPHGHTCDILPFAHDLLRCAPHPMLHSPGHKHPDVSPEGIPPATDADAFYARGTPLYSVWLKSAFPSSALSLRQRSLKQTSSQSLGAGWGAKRTFFDRIACTSIVRDTFSLHAAQIRVRSEKPNKGRKPKATQCLSLCRLAQTHSTLDSSHSTPWHDLRHRADCTIFCKQTFLERASTRTDMQRASTRPLLRCALPQHRADDRTLQKRRKLL